jgi:uncharacterized integral membrane protein
VGAWRAAVGARASGALRSALAPRTATIEAEVSAQTKQVPPARPEKGKLERRNRREVARSGAILALTALVVVFAVVNLGDVKVDWIFGSGHAPLIVVIVISLLVGIVLTHFTDRVSRLRK